MVGCLNIGANAWFIQGNNSEEINDGPAPTKCNDTAIACAWAAVTPKFEELLKNNPFGGHWAMQVEDYIDRYFHTESNWEKFKLVRNLPLTHVQKDDVNGPFQPERITQYHQLACREVLGLGADFQGPVTFEKFVYAVRQGTALIICLENPGHYVTCVAYDPDKNLIGFKDPAPVRWKQETMDKNKNKWFGPKDMDNIKWGYTRVWRL